MEQRNVLKEDRQGNPEEEGWLAIFQRQVKLLDIYLFALDACLQVNGDRWWWRRAMSENAFADPVASLRTLKEFCLHNLLYEAGDVGVFCRAYELLEEEGLLQGDEEGHFLLELTRYLKEALRQAAGRGTGRDRPAESYPAAVLGKLRQIVGRVGKARRPAVVSIIIPDDVTLANFLEFCVPSLAGGRGLRSLARARSLRLLIDARPGYLETIKRQLKADRLGCTVSCEEIPAHLLNLVDAANGPERGWLTGALQGLHLSEARRLGADYVSINPNAIYADAFFEKVMRLATNGRSAVLLATFRANKDSMRPLLKRFRRFRPGRSAAIPARYLVGMGLQTVVAAHLATLVQDSRYFRGETTHLDLMWEGEDFVQIHTTQYEVAFLAGQVLEEMPERFFMKPSAELDRILAADGSTHFVDKSDGIALLDVSGPNDAYGGQGMAYADFGRLIGETTRERQGEFFQHPVRLPVLRTSSLQSPWRPAATIEAELGAVSQAMAGTRVSETPTTSQALAALHVLHLYEISEYGRENLLGTICEGRRIVRLAQMDFTSISEADLRTFIRAAMNFDDVGRAIELAKKGQEGTAFIHDFLVEMVQIKAANETRARELSAKFRGASFAVIGSVVWGQQYIDRFMDYCLPSLLTSGNIPALSENKKVVHSIVTTESDRDHIVAHPAFARLSAVAEIVFVCFSSSHLERREKCRYNFYEFYGLLDHQNVFLASALGADLYLLPIDCVYSKDCLKHFAANIESDADCCSIAAIEVDDTEFYRWLSGKVRDATPILDLVADDLLQAAGERPDAYFRSLVMSSGNAAFCRHPRELIWPIADGLVIHSIFMHPLAVSARLLSRPFHAFHENVDYALLPRLLQSDGRLKIVQDAREAAIAHLGAPLARNDYIEGGFSLQNFLEARKYDYAVHRQCFGTGQRFAIRDFSYDPSPTYEAEQERIQRLLTRRRYRCA